MQATIIDAGTLRKQLTITYTAAEVQARRVDVLKRLAGRVRLDGFRPGKSSQAIVEKRYGQAATEQAREDLADEGFRSALAEHKIKPVGPVANDGITSDNGLVVKCSFDVRPEIVLPEPTALGIDTTAVAVSDQELEEVLGTISRQSGQLAPLAADQTVVENDSVTLIGAVTVAGAEVRKLHDFHHLVGGYPLLGKAPAEVVTAFAGKKVGDTVEVTTTLPASFVPAESAGKEAVVTATIQAVQRQSAVPVDDELAKRLGYADLATMKDGIKARLAERKENDLHMKQLDQITEALLAKVQVTVPPKLLADTITANLEGRVKQAETEGKPAEEIEKFKAEIPAQVEKSLRRFLILDAISDKHQIGVTQEDLAGQIQMAASRTGRKPEEIAKQLQSSGQMPQVVGEIREAKALELFLDLAMGRTPAANPGHGQAGHVHGPDCQH